MQMLRLVLLTPGFQRSMNARIEATCARLADDALGAAEASQRKVEEVAQGAEASRRRIEDVARQAEAGFEVARVDVTGLRAELARHRTTPKACCPRHGRSTSRPVRHFRRSIAEKSRTPHVGSCRVRSPAQRLQSERPPPALQGKAEAAEPRVAARLGQQILQLSEVLRRVVQTQASLQHHVSQRGGAASDAGSAATPAPAAGSSDAGDIGAPSKARRRGAIDELYRELRRLEEAGAGAGHADAGPARGLRRTSTSTPAWARREPNSATQGRAVR